jgi:MOSC domain-containing protein YiiM
VRIGDRFRINNVILEATAPRLPCGVFAAHVEERGWVKRFAEARRTGIYARVVAGGVVSARDSVELLGGGKLHPPVETLLDVWATRRPESGTLERLLASPLSERARAECLRKQQLLRGAQAAERADAWLGAQP